jgi:hypothetical protein
MDNDRIICLVKLASSAGPKKDHGDKRISDLAGTTKLIPLKNLSAGKMDRSWKPYPGHATVGEKIHKSSKGTLRRLNVHGGKVDKKWSPWEKEMKD